MFLFRRVSRWTGRRLVGLVVALLLTLGAAGYLLWPTTVKIQVDGTRQTVTTCAGTVSGALASAGVGLDAGDQVSPAPEARLRQGMLITVNKMVPLTFAVSGKHVVIDVPYNQAKELLGSEPENNDAVLCISKMVSRSVVDEQVIPFQEERRVDYGLTAGTVKTIQSGQNGLMQCVTLVTEKDGVEVGRTVLKKQVITEPRNQVLLIGSRSPINSTVSRHDLTAFQPRAEMVMEATAYTHTGNRTATGIYPYVGVVAVDPRVIPLGTRLFVEGYGPAVAADTGGLIKGRIIDVFFDTEEECIQWGRRKVKVYILE